MFLADFSKSKILRNSLIAGGLIASGIPQYAVELTSGTLMTKFKPEDKNELKKLSKKHKVKLEFPNNKKLDKMSRKYGGINGNGAWAIPARNKIILGKDGMRSKSVFYHELGHIKDKGLKYDRKANPKGLKTTAHMLRNETAANINAIKENGIAQVPHAGLNSVNYGANAIGRHALGIGALVAGGGAGLHYLKKLK